MAPYWKISVSIFWLIFYVISLPDSVADRMLLIIDKSLVGLFLMKKKFHCMHKNLCTFSLFSEFMVYYYYSRISKAVMLKAWDPTEMSPGLLQREKRLSELGSWVYLVVSTR